MTSSASPSTTRHEAPFTHPRRVHIALLLLIVIALLSSRDLLRMTSHGAAGGAEAVPYIERFGAVKNVLPARGVICYAPDPRVEPNATKDYFLAQYALAPLVLRTTGGCDLLITNFADDSHRASAGPANYVLIENFGNGVALFRKAK